LSDAWVGVVGALLGFAASFLIERSRRLYEAAHRFEADRRALYAEFMREAREIEERIRERRSRLELRREHPDLVADLERVRVERPDLARLLEVPERPDFGQLERLGDEIELLGARHIEFRASFFSFALSELGYAVENADEAGWEKASRELQGARREFVRAARRDLDLPSDVMTRWQERRWRLKKRLRLARRPRPAPTESGGAAEPPEEPRP
jgi:hypothetical protein